MPEIIAACKQHGIELVKTNYLKKDTSLKAVIKSIKKRSPELVLVGGGDGTISDAVDFFAGSSMEVGVLPLGTTNNFARSLGMPLEINAAIASIRNGKVSMIDLGKIHDEYFVNVVGIGISAQIAKNVTDHQKKKF
ncbi:MAG TPA: diacylglycerol kinase family protein, partial [Candidatus Saccharimonadales bacterium]|nr:diacylglycerol kinase family protein [Candidatus Saccharimonadales bacterium]